VNPPEKVVGWRDNPVAFVEEVFGPGYFEEKREPLEVEDWQRQGLSYLVQHEPHDWCDGSPAKGIALRGAKGIGKGVEDAWIVWWLEACFPYPNVAAMSVSADNLRDNLWKELAVWYGRSPMLQKMFEFRGERIVPRNASRDLEDKWYCSARSFPQKPDKDQQAAAVQGLHTEHVAVLIDEGGSVPPGVLHAAEGIHANPVHSLVVVSGNCDSMEGALYDASVKRAHRYHVIKVTGDPRDPKCSKRIDKEHNRQLIEDYGLNDPVVLINVLAEFPKTGISRLLGPEDIEKAVKRQIPNDAIEQDVKVAALDIARQGIDSSVYTLRQGDVHFEQRVWRIPDLMVLADQVAMRLNEDKPDALIVLATGLGWGVVDRLRQMGFGEIIIAVDEGTDALDGKFANRRAEMWFNGAEWVKLRGQLLKDPELHADLQAMGYRYRFYKGATRVLLDPAEEVRSRLGRSPDKGTSFVGTFAAPVAPRGLREAKNANQYVETDYDPWAVLRGGNR
jgi:hypothetical protein